MTSAADYERRALETAVAASDTLIRGILEAVCQRNGLSLDSAVTPGEPARNYELALHLGIGHVFGLGLRPQPAVKSVPGRWRWCCTLCDPPCLGSRGTDGWRKILTTSMPRHFSHRQCHHGYVRRTAR